MCSETRWRRARLLRNEVCGPREPRTFEQSAAVAERNREEDRRNHDGHPEGHCEAADDVTAHGAHNVTKRQTKQQRAKEPQREAIGFAHGLVRRLPACPQNTLVKGPLVTEIIAAAGVRIRPKATPPHGGSKSLWISCLAAWAEGT